MKTSFLFRRPALAMAASVLALAACSKTDTPAPPVADMGRVTFIHAAAASNTPLTAFINDQQVSQLNYGQSSSYASVNAGTPMLRINNGAQVAIPSQALTVAKDQSYSVFEYSPTTAIGSLGILSVADTPVPLNAGEAQVRVVYLIAGGVSPIRLTAPSPSPTTPAIDLTPDVAFGTSSPFVKLTAGVFNLSITSNGSPRPQVVGVGDGTGTGTGVYKYLEGKAYTIVVRGIAGSGVPIAQQPQAVIIPNN
ncbi:DUF4397 domain-containing protein [Hymenobacter sp. UYCo722]|uniref:DUF4397 domain-containing protein n=1 Tax=Hymenobacter sp. UYCo722 TaxID=3156335 RepID=UPI003396F8AA